MKRMRESDTGVQMNSAISRITKLMKHPTYVRLAALPEDEHPVCINCDGEKKVEHRPIDPDGEYGWEIIECPRCNGTGIDPETKGELGMVVPEAEKAAMLEALYDQASQRGYKVVPHDSGEFTIIKPGYGGKEDIKIPAEDVEDALYLITVNSSIARITADGIMTTYDPATKDITTLDTGSLAGIRQRQKYALEGMVLPQLTELTRLMTGRNEAEVPYSSDSLQADLDTLDQIRNIFERELKHVAVTMDQFIESGDDYYDPAENSAIARITKVMKAMRVTAEDPPQVEDARWPLTETPEKIFELLTSDVSLLGGDVAQAENDLRDYGYVMSDSVTSLRSSLQMISYYIDALGQQSQNHYDENK